MKPIIIFLTLLLCVISQAKANENEYVFPNGARISNAKIASDWLQMRKISGRTLDGLSDTISRTSIDGSIYRGQVNADNSRHGYGIYTWSDGDVFEGRFDEGQFVEGIYYYMSGGCYIGSFSAVESASKSGYGEMFWQNGNVYAGFWKNNEQYGYGKLQWSNGDVYTGIWENSQPNTYGELRKTDGFVYKGIWSNGTKRGYGEYTRSDGMKYIGFADDGVFNGYGILHATDGSTYAGNWAEGKRAGFGVATFNTDVKKGETYVGQWASDTPNGAGAYFYANGKRTTGIFMNGKLKKKQDVADVESALGIAISKYDIHPYADANYTFPGGRQLPKLQIARNWISSSKIAGLTVDKVKSVLDITLNNGSTYRGQALSSGILNGYGILKWSNGDVFEGYFEDGYYIRGIFYYHNGCCYIGSFKKGTHNKQGYGELYWPDGDVYKGFFENNMREGQGSYAYSNGDYYSGFWDADKKAGYGLFTGSNRSGRGTQYEGFWANDTPQGMGTYVYADGTTQSGIFDNGKLLEPFALPENLHAPETLLADATPTKLEPVQEVAPDPEPEQKPEPTPEPVRDAAPEPEPEPKPQPGPKTEPATLYADSGEEIDCNIPVCPVKDENTFAVIISNENYTRLAKVPYANADGEIFANYCEKTLGLPSENIRRYPDATFGTMLEALDDIRNIARAYRGDLNVIFYYAGHGAPEETTSEAYLIPVDAFGVRKEICLSLHTLYNELNELDAKMVTVFLDACFSGSTREGGMLASARGVAIKAKEEVLPSGNMLVFSASTGDQTALPYKSKGHGLFTYYLVKKLKETHGDVTYGDLHDYVTMNVERKSNVINRKSQTPTITVSSSLGNDWRALRLKP